MKLNRILGRKGKEEEQKKEFELEDLIALERYDEAEEVLRTRLKRHPKDLHAHLKLAEVYVATKNAQKALAEYTYVADIYAEDGFFDKGIALLSKAARMAPSDEMLPRRIEQFRRLKRLEHRRRQAILGLRSNRSMGALASGDRALAVEMLWNKIAKSHLVDLLGGERLKRLFSVMEMVEMPKGAVIAREGSRESVMYLVVDGVVEAGVDHEEQFVNIRSFTTGQVVGESTLVERKAWPADYRVDRSSTFFRLDREGLAEAMKGDDDPRALLSTLCKQHNDRDVAANVYRLRKS